MRITREARQATRRGILDAARRLFAEQGFEPTTTRDLARTAGIAAGTLFNYFPTKEAIVTALASEALARGRSDFEGRRREQASLEEDLFAHVAAGLRRLRPLRKFLQPVLEAAFSPASAGADDAGAALRSEHLECVGRVLAAHGMDASSPLALQLYWTLYTGVLGFWVADRSPKQEDTLALLDQSIAMFAAWLRGSSSAVAGNGDHNTHPNP
ncbi:MAG TPA: TetR family transcriptional regulator [Planctomycetaceae bacterium]|nr:TetR family transcriptional regulator [Planctomycetaceae bacterium]